MKLSIFIRCFAMASIRSSFDDKVNICTSRLDKMLFASWSCILAVVTYSSVLHRTKSLVI